MKKNKTRMMLPVRDHWSDWMSSAAAAWSLHNERCTCQTLQSCGWSQSEISGPGRGNWNLAHEQEIAILGYHTWCDRCIEDIIFNDKQLLNRLPTPLLFSSWIVNFRPYYMSVCAKQQSCIVRSDFAALIHLSEACLYLGVLRTCKRLYSIKVISKWNPMA